MKPELFVAAFPHDGDRVLYVMKNTWRCRSCERDVKLVVEIEGAPPVCVPCAETSNPSHPKENKRG